MYNPTDNDIRLVTQGIKNVKTKIEILDDNDSVLGVIYGTVSDGSLLFVVVYGTVSVIC